MHMENKSAYKELGAYIKDILTITKKQAAFVLIVMLVCIAGLAGLLAWEIISGYILAAIVSLLVGLIILLNIFINIVFKSKILFPSIRNGYENDWKELN